MKDGSAEKRAKAVRALGLLPGNEEAEKAAINALQDKNPNVRMAAATALGSMQAEHAKLGIGRHSPGFRANGGARGGKFAAFCSMMTWAMTFTTTC